MAERLKTAREAAGFSTVPEACQRFGWKQSTYFGHENGSRGITTKMAAEYGRAFRVSPEWILFGGASPPARQAADEPGDLVNVYNVEASAGHGALVDSEMIVDRLSFPPGYLRRITSAKPKDLAIIGVKGKSMEPTLSDDDVVMIDMSKRDLSFDGLFVLRDGGASLLVKRVGRGRRRGTVMLISDNPTFHPVEREIEEIEVVGKVVWKGVKE
jgi:phage repressor protein C with HTH and peptisase S24 domain